MLVMIDTRADFAAIARAVEARRDFPEQEWVVGRVCRIGKRGKPAARVGFCGRLALFRAWRGKV
jgi:hypothetical protein